jgi:hypothetical protein
MEGCVQSAGVVSGTRDELCSGAATRMRREGIQKFEIREPGWRASRPGKGDLATLGGLRIPKS